MVSVREVLGSSLYVCICPPFALCFCSALSPSENLHLHVQDGAASEGGCWIVIYIHFLIAQAFGRVGNLTPTSDISKDISQPPPDI